MNQLQQKEKTNTAGRTGIYVREKAEKAGDIMRDTAGKAGDIVRDTAGKAGDIVRDTAGKAGDLVRGTAGKAGDIVRDTAARAGDIARDTAEKAEELREKVGTEVRRQVTKQIRRTQALKFYLFKFACRIAIFAAVLGLYITHRTWLEEFMNQPFWKGITLVHVIWAIFMGIMILHLFPNNRLSMALRKMKETEFREAEGYSEFELLQVMQKNNVRAWQVLLVWLSFNAVFGVLYLFGVIRSSDLLMLTVFYFLCDYICILLFCPFQTFIMKNKCCINCRIYDWGHFMMFTPMLFIRNFYSWSLFFTSVIVLIHWEITVAAHPERFWSGSNLTLQCANCREQTCQIKKRLAAKGSLRKKTS